MACWISNLIQVYEKYDGHQDYLLTSVCFYSNGDVKGIAMPQSFSHVVFNILFYHLVVGSHEHSVLML